MGSEESDQEIANLLEEGIIKWQENTTAALESEKYHSAKKRGFEHVLWYNEWFGEGWAEPLPTSGTVYLYIFNPEKHILTQSNTLTKSVLSCKIISRSRMIKTLRLNWVICHCLPNRCLKLDEKHFSQLYLLYLKNNFIILPG